MRTLTGHDEDVLRSRDRTARVQVKLEDADGTLVDVTDFHGYNWLTSCEVNVTTDPPISTATIKLQRTIGALSLVPLLEGSPLNLNAAGSYSPLVNPNRDVEIRTATMMAGADVGSADYDEFVWKGISAPIDWGGEGPITIHCRDLMTKLNRTLLESVAQYGSDAGTTDITAALQAILDAGFGASVIPLTTVGTPGFAILGGERGLIGNVTVLAACKALVDLIGWNLHVKWNAAAGDFRLTLWEPDRAATTASWTFARDGVVSLPVVGLDDDGIRNAAEVVFLDTSDAQQTRTDTRAASITSYDRRFIRVDARGTSVSTNAQADDMIDAILDDLQLPVIQQVADVPYFWPVELGDLYAFSANRHYDTEQKFAVYGYRHVLTKDSARTILSLSAKPSGGYARWHGIESGGTQPALLPPAPSLEVTFDANGNTVVSVSASPTASITYVKVGDGSSPADPSAAANDGSVSGRSGTVATSVKITTGNDAYVKAITFDYDGNASAVGSARTARRLGPAHRDSTTRSTSGTGEDTLQTITIPAGVMGLNGSIRLTAYFDVNGVASTKVIRVKFGGTTLHADFMNSTAPESVRWEVIITNVASASSQFSVISVLNSDTGAANQVTGATAASTINTGSAADIVITGEVANALDQVDLVFSLVEFLGTN